jgi:hypothetical protein
MHFESSPGSIKEGWGPVAKITELAEPRTKVANSGIGGGDCLATLGPIA